LYAFHKKAEMLKVILVLMKNRSVIN
jgi:hypothetical protein